MTRLRAFRVGRPTLLMFLLLLIIASGPLLTSARADVSTSQSCTSAVPWTVKANWGSSYTDTKGVTRFAVTVSWTAASSDRLTQWEVRSYNGDGSIAGTKTGQDSYAYANGTGWRQVDAVDPTGAGASVRVRVGVALDGKADCLLSFPAPASTTPSPSPTATATPTVKPTATTTPTPTPTATPTASPTATATATPTATPTASPSPTQGPILFQDDFSGPAGQTFDHSKWQDWSACTYSPSAAFGDIQCGDNETLDGQGHLQIPATPTTGSALSTATKFGFTYGVASAWIKVPAADGYWPAFWTLNAEPGYGPKTLPVGELDVMEQYTTWDTAYNRSVHNWNGDQTWHGGIATCGNVDLTAGFHKYSVRVEPGKLSFFFDDQPCGRVITSDMGNGLPYAFGPSKMDPNFLILDLAVGGAGGQQNPATTPATLLVDRVEVRGL